MKIFNDVVLANKEYVDIIVNGPYTLKIHSMGLVDANNKVNFYDGKVSVVDTEGKELYKYAPTEYRDYIAERVEPWTYLKFPYLKKIGWKGFVEGQDSGVYQATPLSRLNASDGMATPVAQEEYERMYSTLGGKPVNATLAMHWARLVELIYAAEHCLELAQIRDHQPGLEGKNRKDAYRRCRYRGSPARNADPSLLDRSERHGNQSQPDRRNDQQPCGHQHVDQKSSTGAH